MNVAIIGATGAVGAEVIACLENRKFPLNRLKLLASANSNVTVAMYTLQSQFSFDGSVGAYYKFNENFNLGGFWYGQYHSWNYKNHDIPLDQDISGSQSLLFSNVEVRAGYTF